MSKNHHTPDSKVMAYGKLREYVAAEAVDEAANELVLSMKKPGEGIMDFGAFYGTKC